MKVAPSDYLKWYRPIDPTLRSFLHDYYKKKKNLNKTPCFCKGPTMRHLGGCTLLKRNKYSKMRETTLTNVIFANFTKYEIEINVKWTLCVLPRIQRVPFLFLDDFFGLNI